MLWSHRVPNPNPFDAGRTTLAPSHRQSFVRQLTRTSTRSFAWGEGGRTKGDTKTGATLSALDVRP